MITVSLDELLVGATEFGFKRYLKVYTRFEPWVIDQFWEDQDFVDEMREKFWAEYVDMCRASQKAAKERDLNVWGR
jgi:hypothetical protein